jgi:hypothetical protein
MRLKLEDEDGRPWTASTNFGWITLVVVLTFGTAAVLLGLYLSLWIRSKGRALWPLIGFMTVAASAGLLFVLSHISPQQSIPGVIDNFVAFSGVAATFSLRHEIQRYYKESENWRIDIGPFFTLFFSVIYINYCLNPLTLPERNPTTSLNLRK